MHTPRILRTLTASALVALAGACASLADPAAVEVSVCGWPKEPLVFALWSHIAGRAGADDGSRLANAEAISYRTRDGRRLAGHRLRSTAPGGAVVGTLLVAPGNAMLSHQLLPYLSNFAARGLEVVIYDYRGYGASEGKRRLKAIVSDYREIAQQLASSARGRTILYGISFGGIVVLNSIAAGVRYDRAIIDSTPSRVSPRGCPPAYDPVANLPADASRLLLIAGERDTVVPSRDSAELLRRGQAQGARSELRADFAHPFMDPDPAVQQARGDLIRDFMLR